MVALERNQGIEPCPPDYETGMPPKTPIAQFLLYSIIKQQSVGAPGFEPGLLANQAKRVYKTRVLTVTLYPHYQRAHLMSTSRFLTWLNQTKHLAKLISIQIAGMTGIEPALSP